jgi:hypothetical protein
MFNMADEDWLPETGNLTNNIPFPHANEVHRPFFWNHDSDCINAPQSLAPFAAIGAFALFLRGSGVRMGLQVAGPEPALA